MFTNPTQSLPLEERWVDTFLPPLLCGRFNGPYFLDFELRVGLALILFSTQGLTLGNAPG